MGQSIQEWTKWNFLQAAFHKFHLVHSWILCPIWSMINSLNKLFLKKTLWHLFMKWVLWVFYHKFPEIPGTPSTLSTSEGWKAELTLEPVSGFEHGTPVHCSTDLLYRSSTTHKLGIHTWVHTKCRIISNHANWKMTFRSISIIKKMN